MGNVLMCCCGSRTDKPLYSNLESFRSITPMISNRFSLSASGPIADVRLHVIKALIVQDENTEKMLQTFLEKYINNLQNEEFAERIAGVLSSLDQPLSTVFWDACDTMEAIYEQSEIALALSTRLVFDNKSNYFVQSVEDPLLSSAYQALCVTTLLKGTWVIYGREFTYELLILERRERLLIATHSITVLGIVQRQQVKIKLETVKNHIVLSFADSETSFQGLYDPACFKIRGESIQTVGLDKGAKGSFILFH